MSRRADILAEVPGIEGAAPDAVVALAGLFDGLLVEDGHVVFSEGDPAEAIYLLAEGAVEVFKRADDGSERVLAVLSPGTVFGHAGLFSNAERTAGVRAVGACDLMVMSAERLRKVLRDWDFTVASPLRRILIVSMARQLAEADRALGELASEFGVAEGAPAVLPDEARDRLFRAQGRV